jgi:protein arginine N-methyltransferase 1
MYDKGHATTLEYHRSMLVDSARTLSLKQAIEQTVLPGDVVLDLGCGSGILTFFACRAGAQRVYALDSGDIIELARALCRRNGFDQQVVWINELSTQANLPEKVDVIVSETIGNFGLEEGILEWLIDGKKRFLKPGGKIIPQALQLFIALVEKPAQYQLIQDWENLPYDLDFTPGRALAANNLYTVKLAPKDFLAPPTPLLSVDLLQVETNSAAGVTEVEITRSGALHGIGGWFSAQLTPDLSLTNAPGGNTPSWVHTFLPLDHPVSVNAGDRLKIGVQSRLNSSVWVWQVEPPGGQKIRQSSLFGKLQSPTGLRKQAISFHPRRSPDGDIALQVLSAMDGSQTQAEIARGLEERYPERFRQPETALQFVVRLSLAYSADETTG